MVIADPSDMMAPGCCTLCGRGNADPVKYMVDTGLRFDPPIQTDRNGAMYVCSHCVGELAEAAGYVLQESVDADLSAASDRAREADELAGRINAGLAEIEAAVATIRKEADSGEGPSDGSE